jgi:hypothetical protein
LRLCVLICIPLTACSLGDAINHQIFDYYQVNDQASNQIILLNILYARDGAPLHFSELSQIRGQISAGVSASTTFPYGVIGHANPAPRDLGTLGATVSSSPSFDIVSLDTKDFTAGVMEPITPQAVSFFLNEGIDYRMVLMLLASGIRPAGNSEVVLNAPTDSRIVCNKDPHSFGTNAELKNYRIIAADEACVNPFLELFAFLNIVNHMKRLYPVAAEAPPRPVGPPFSLAMNSNLRAVTSIDPTKYRLVRLRSGQYQLMTAPRSSMVVLCEADTDSSRVVSVLTDAQGASIRVRADACSTRRSSDDDEAGSAPPAKMVTIGVTPGTYAIQLRSTLEVIRYVGQILAFQESETAKHPQLPERCITLQFVAYDALHATCDGAVLIHLANTTSLIAVPDLSVVYHGERWSVAAPHTCLSQEHCDLSQQTMSIIALLLNRNKSAKDIRSTPAVEVVP